MTDYALKLVNGVARMMPIISTTTIVTSEGIPIYDEYIALVSDITAGSSITLPNGGSYMDSELEVYLNGIRIDHIVDYNYVGSGVRTAISMLYDLKIGDKLRFRVDRANIPVVVIPIYDEYITLVALILAGTPVTLPNGGTYVDKELEVYLNGIRIDKIIDFNYVGSGTKTQVSFVSDLMIDDTIRFRVDRGA